MNKYSAAERDSHLSAWRASGLSGKEYCRQNSIISTTFYSWIKSEKTGTHKRSESQPLLVKVQSDTQPSRNLTFAMCIEYRDIRIHLPADIRSESLRSILILLGVIDAS